MTDKDERGLHLGIIPDGNRRYAKARYLPIVEGYITGIERLYAILFLLGEAPETFPIKNVTIYICSVDNLTKRSSTEVEQLYTLFRLQFRRHLDNRDSPIHQYQIRIRFIGDLSRFPVELRDLAENLEAQTAHYDTYTVNLAMGYDGRQEIVTAATGCLDQLSVPAVTRQLTVPDFDLIIRTGGEYRTSGFFPWQSVYAEWFFLDKMWPEFTTDDLHRIIGEFNRRNRRFGA
jgi:undecaprenyl diphosphate synthase